MTPGMGCRKLCTLVTSHANNSPLWHILLHAAACNSARSCQCPQEDPDPSTQPLDCCLLLHPAATQARVRCHTAVPAVSSRHICCPLQPQPSRHGSSHMKLTTQMQHALHLTLAQWLINSTLSAACMQSSRQQAHNPLLRGYSSPCTSQCTAVSDV
jgi:hypothetical protein